MEECLYRKVGCTIYKDKILECNGACGWVVDYRGLIEKGLAIKAPKEMYK